ncbi:MAG: DUF3683 domain-containing protein [Magnetococcales bacterium]|nr:DUF3683 domain-containing protein [Magnetococcales bacterium]NGZ05309.1 DUF3683 domain-containing protein [Magnetococcales bacterium]
MSQTAKIREIPYNYTSFSDREIVIRFLGTTMWETLETLRSQRETGRSARMLFGILGDLWVISRNPFLQEDLLTHPKRLEALISTMTQRIQLIVDRAKGNPLVFQLVDRLREAVKDFGEWFPRRAALRRRAQQALAQVTREENIDFTPMARVAHITDATDWRVECPALVLKPDREEEVAALVTVCIDLGMPIIPRGGGTGYTGSGVALHPDTVIINTEKLDFIHPVTHQTPPGLTHTVATIRVGAGAITARVEEAASQAGLVFAVDPTSKNASTIGGNIAMNAGGKKAVRWGTTLDNLLSWRMVTPDGEWLEVERLDHNLGKIHNLPEARFRITRFGSDGQIPVGEPTQLSIPASDFRKPGLGKDVTNKALAGLPGIQKEGCDGLVTSALFVLHPKPLHTRTVCLEFFGADLSRAVPAIVETKDYLEQTPGVACAGLEHLDERYLRAVGYNVKASRGEHPKMAILADIVGDEEALVDQAARHVTELARRRDGEGFIAVSPEERARYWADRARTAAIAAHTNAFKINEDVVIPLERLAEYNTGIERINIIQSTRNKIQMLDEIERFLSGASFARLLPADYPNSEESLASVAAKREAGLTLIARIRTRWQAILDHFDGWTVDHPELLDHPEQARPEQRICDLLLHREMRISFRQEVQRPLNNAFGGELWEGVRRELETIHHTVRTRRLFVALHMHAGDGNVHTNIPVNSNDYEMLQEAERIVDQIMALAIALDGRVSGEHGIGLTKFRYLDPEIVEAFVAYKQIVDPNNRFNPGKLLPGSGLDNAYTPSLRLVQQEALILRESAMGALNDDVRNCLRCGKCKKVCSTHVPHANLLYSPRDKILATGLIIEAFLYEEQARRKVSLSHFDALTDLADHCAICRRCGTPCPVNIDFADVTMRMRELLKSRTRRSGRIGHRMALAFLSATDPRVIRLARQFFILGGYAAQRWSHKIWKQLTRRHRRPDEPPKAAAGRAPNVVEQVVPLLERPLPAGLPSRSARGFLDIEDPNIIPVLRDPDRWEPKLESLFYFPGCGCERLFSDISLASIAMMLHVGAQVVLPPGAICCGFPQSASGLEALSRQITMRNRVLFHRVAHALSHMEIQTVVVSCGTCLDQLEKYHFETIFPGCRLLDVHEYLMEKGVQMRSGQTEPILFHDPCHSPMKRHPPLVVASRLMGRPVQLSDRCCGEAGTFSVSRPDIAAQVRFRKEEELGLTQHADHARHILTACPSCYQGLSRLEHTQASFMVVELTRSLLGESWRETFLQRMERGGLERVLL